MWTRAAPGILSAVVLGSCLAACGGLGEFRVQESATTTVERGTIIERIVGDLGFGDFLNMDITENQSLENQGVEKHQVRSVKVSAVRLHIIEPEQGQDFTFVEELEFFVEADGLDRTLVAAGADFASGETEISLGTEASDIVDHATAESMTIVTEARGRRPDQDTTIRADIEIDVVADLPGLLWGP